MQPENSQNNIKIKVIGVGGAGNNAINSLMNENIEGVELWVANTDSQDLQKSPCTNQIKLGKSEFGLGAGGNPELGKKYALESTGEIKDILKDCSMLILYAGMGGGTGTGATPVIAKTAREMGILTYAIVTTPFNSLFDGVAKQKIAKLGLEELKKNVDSYMVISNEKIQNNYASIPLNQMLKFANIPLKNSIDVIRLILHKPFFMNVDFNDIKNTLKESGECLITHIKATGKDKINSAIESIFRDDILEIENISSDKIIVIFNSDKGTTFNDYNKVLEAINQKIKTSDNTVKKVGIINENDDEKEEFISVSLVVGDIDRSQGQGSENINTMQEVDNETIEKDDEIIEKESEIKEIEIDDSNNQINFDMDDDFKNDDMPNFFQKD